MYRINLLNPEHREERVHEWSNSDTGKTVLTFITVMGFFAWMFFGK